MNSDEFYLQKALELAVQAQGETTPNPMVGCIVLDADGQLVGQGFHRKAGTPHAEIVALHEAGARARGGTMYVNLEPCCHYGRTPPCTGAIIEAGLKKVYVGSIDPNPKVSGQGVRTLREAGIEVQAGLLEERCRELNRFFFHWVRTRRPWVSLKVAASLNGKLNYSAQAQGYSSWITGPEAHQKVQELRSIYDVVLTGSGTVLADNPRLTVRTLPKRSPWRVVLDRRGRTNPQAKVHQSPEPVLLFTQNPLENRSFPKNVEQIPWNGKLAEVIELLGQRERLAVLVEAGPQLFSAFLQEEFFQDLYYFLNPQLLIGESGSNCFGGKQLELPWKSRQISECGSDLLLYFRRE